MKRSVTLLTKLDPLTPVDGDCALLLECAPDADMPLQTRAIGRLDDLIGSAAQAKLRAWELTQKLITGEPPFYGVLQLHVMEEILIRALENIFYAIHLDRWLQGTGAEECRLRAPSPYIERLRSIQQLAGSKYLIVAPAAEKVSLSHKVRRRILNKGLAGLSDSMVLGARRFFPNAARYLAAMPKARRARTRGGWWLYSTAYTFTNIGLAYEPYLPQPLNYLVDSSETGDVPLRERGRDFHDLYAWASTADIPSRKSIAEIQTALVKQINSARLSGDEELARTALLRTGDFQTYLRRILPLTCFHSRIADKFFDETSTELLVVGNAAFEGPLLQRARAKGIPTVLLQHGILGDYYQLMDQPSDTLLVRGDFWKEFVSQAMRPRTRVLNIPAPTTRVEMSSRDVHILFLTSVDAALTHTHEADLAQIVSRLLRVAHAHARTLVVRVHPMETVGYYREVVERMSAQLQQMPRVEYSQGPGLDQILDKTAVAVTYSSTVFLDCLHRGIPIVSFDWHDFAYKSLIEHHRVFHFAKDLADLERMVGQALHGELAASKSYDQFLASTSQRELQQFFEGAVRKSLAQPSGD